MTYSQPYARVETARDSFDLDSLNSIDTPRPRRCCIYKGFQPFPRLPIELRLKIWSYLMPPSRIIELQWNDRKRKWHSRNKRDPQEQCNVLTRITKESREHYFASYRTIGSAKVCDYLTINSKIDILYLSWGSGLPNIAKGQLAAIDGLIAIRYIACSVFECHRIYNRRFLERFPKLRIVYTILKDDEVFQFKPKSGSKITFSTIAAADGRCLMLSSVLETLDGRYKRFTAAGSRAPVLVTRDARRNQLPDLTTKGAHRWPGFRHDDTHEPGFW